MRPRCGGRGTAATERRTIYALGSARRRTKVGLSWILAGHIGVAGPVVASAVTMGLLLVFPSVAAALRLPVATADAAAATVAY